LRVALVLCLAVLGLVVAVAGCGSGSSSSDRVSPKRYATALCSAVGPFEADIAKRQGALDPTNIKNAQQGKSALIGFLDAISADTQTAAGKLKAAGVPDVKDGKRIATAFVDLFERLQSTLQMAVTRAKSLPTGSPQAFRTAANSLAADVKSTMGDLGAGLTGLRSPKLEAAARKVSACQALG
jgi:hypothetical protein